MFTGHVQHAQYHFQSNDHSRLYWNKFLAYNLLKTFIQLLARWITFMAEWASFLLQQRDPNKEWIRPRAAVKVIQCVLWQRWLATTSTIKRLWEGHATSILKAPLLYSWESSLGSHWHWIDQWVSRSLKQDELVIVFPMTKYRPFLIVRKWSSIKTLLCILFTI